MNARPAKGSTGDRTFTSEASLTTALNFAEVSEFDLDPCADDLSKCARDFYTIESDGLTQPWFGNVFVNPPWSKIGPWVAKAQVEIASGTAASVTFLLPDNRQSAAWWADYVEPFRDGRSQAVTVTTHFLRGRPRYWSPTIAPGSAKSPPFGAVIIVMRSKS